jgi:uncharacterized protein
MSELPPIPQHVPIREPFFRRISPIAFVALSLGLVFVLYQLVAGVLVLVLFGMVLKQETVAAMRIATVVAQLLCILVPTMLLTRARYGSIRVPLRVKMPSFVDLILVSVSLFALQQILQAYMIAQDAIPLPPEVQRQVEIFKHLIERTYRLLVAADSPLELVGVVITVAVVPAVVEELLFRGLVQVDLERVTKGFTAAVIAGVIFALYHVNPFSIVPLMALGIYFGFIVHRSQNIVLAMVAHFLNNFLATLAEYLHLDENYMVFAPAVEAGTLAIILNTIVSAVVFAAATYFFVRGYSDQKSY